MTLADELERLRKLATEGPLVYASRGGELVTIRLGMMAGTIARDVTPADAELILALRNNLPAIIAALRAQEWQPIETAPDKHSHALAVATGVDGRPMFQVVYYCCAKHMMLSSRHPSECDKVCAFTFEPALGVPYTHWRPLSAGPAHDKGEPKP